jgi:hypothetical protein
MGREKGLDEGRQIERLAYREREGGREGGKARERARARARERERWEAWVHTERGRHGYTETCTSEDFSVTFIQLTLTSTPAFCKLHSPRPPPHTPRTPRTHTHTHTHEHQCLEGSQR